MRKSLAILALLAPTQIAAQPIESPAAPRYVTKDGETLLQLSAAGQVSNPTERIALSFIFRCTAATDEAARVLHDKQWPLVKAELIAAGASAVSDIGEPLGFIGNEAYEDFSSAPARPSVAMSSHSLKVDDMSKWPAIRTVLARHKIDLTVATQTGAASLRDDTSARRQAVAQAITKARREADSYATPLGLKVGRILRVSDSSDAANMQTWMTMMLQRQQRSLETVETVATVTMEFALIPR